MGPSGANSWVAGFVYILGPCGSLQRTLLWGWDFLLLLEPPQIFTARGLRLSALVLELWAVWSILLLSCSSRFIHKQMWDRLLHQPICNPPQSSSCLLAMSLSARLPISTLQLVWMIVSSLTPLWSDFYTVRFSCSSGYFLSLNLLLSFFWLCNEAKFIYLCLHLGRKSLFFSCICLYSYCVIYFFISFWMSLFSC